MTESVCADINGNFIEKVMYQYDSLSVKSIYVDKANKPTKSEYFLYDKQENLLAITLFDENGKITESHTFSYQFDNIGNWISQTTYTEKERNPISITERMITYW
jgi:hypothetical protein